MPNAGEMCFPGCAPAVSPLLEEEAGGYGSLRTESSKVLPSCGFLHARCLDGELGLPGFPVPSFPSPFPSLRLFSPLLLSSSPLSPALLLQDLFHLLFPNHYFFFYFPLLCFFSVFLFIHIFDYISVCLFFPLFFYAVFFFYAIFPLSIQLFFLYISVL